jgi:large subunit ribosomal protein L9
MSNVEVLLRERVQSLGTCGDVVRVKSGFARNYLYPRRLAVPATEENKRMLARRTVRMAAEDAALAADLERRQARLAELELTTVERADAHGHLYGSVNAARAAELLTAAGFPCAERDIRLERPIKNVGTHPVRVHLLRETYGEFRLLVRAEGAALEAGAEAAE